MDRVIHFEVWVLATVISGRFFGQMCFHERLAGWLTRSGGGEVGALALDLARKIPGAAGKSSRFSSSK